MEPTPHRRRPGPSIFLQDVKGFAEALANAKESSYKSRLDMWLAPWHNVCGFKLKTLTVMDYIVLEYQNSPFIHRREPTPKELIDFLWILSPNLEWWTRQNWWAKHLPSLRQFAAYRFGCKAARRFCANMPASSEPLVKSAYQYIDLMFGEQPSYAAKGKDSPLVFLCGWFDLLRSEYHCSMEECWAMPIPQLFQIMKAIRLRRYPQVPDVANSEARVMAKVLKALNSKTATMDDLKSGRVNLFGES